MKKKLTVVIIIFIVLLTAEIILIFFKGSNGMAKPQKDEGLRNAESSETGSDDAAGADKGEPYIDAGNDSSDNISPAYENTAGGSTANDSPTSDNPANDSPTSDSPANDAVSLINEAGATARERIAPPEGFERLTLDEGSFGEYLRNLPLKPHGSSVKYYDGGTKPWDVHVAVIDMDVGTRDLQQCADAVIRLRAEYLYANGKYDQIHFNFTNGFNAKYGKWIQGFRISITGNKAVWVDNGSKGADYKSFRKYLDTVFAYAGTLSLSQEMKKIDLKEMRPGDVFLKGGSPGHCVIIIDMAENPQTGERVFLAAQSYMPAQDIHILKNPANEDGNPWYPMEFGDKLVTPEWTFSKDQTYRFAE